MIQYEEIHENARFKPENKSPSSFIGFDESRLDSGFLFGSIVSFVSGLGDV